MLSQLTSYVIDFLITREFILNWTLKVWGFNLQHLINTAPSSVDFSSLSLPKFNLHC